MPVMGATGALAGIRDYTQTVKLVLLSSHDSEYLPRLAEHLGANACVNKSFLPTELIPALNRLFKMTQVAGQTSMTNRKDKNKISLTEAFTNPS